MSRDTREPAFDWEDFEELSNGDPIRNVKTREVYEQSNGYATRMKDGEWEAIEVDKPWEWELAMPPSDCTKCGFQVVCGRPCPSCWDPQGATDG